MTTRVEHKRHSSIISPVTSSRNGNNSTIVRGPIEYFPLSYELTTIIL